MKTEATLEPNALQSLEYVSEISKKMRENLYKFGSGGFEDEELSSSLFKKT